MARSDQFTVGMDFGTLSGRAVVLRLSDGAELAQRVHEYPPRRRRGPRLPRRGSTPAAGVGVAGAGGLPRRAGGPRCRAAVAASGVDPGHVVAIGTDFTACTMVPCLADGTPLSEVDTGSPTVRTPTSSSGSTTPLRGRPIGSTAWPPPAESPGCRGVRRRCSLGRVGSWRRGCRCFEEEPGVLRPHGPLGGGHGLDRVAAVRVASCAVPAPRIQGDSRQDGRGPGRGPSCGLLAPGFEVVRGREGGRTGPRRSGKRAGALTAQAAAWTGLGARASPSRWATSTRTSPRPRHGRSPGPDGDDHGDLDVPGGQCRGAVRRPGG